MLSLCLCAVQMRYIGPCKVISNRKRDVGSFSSQGENSTTCIVEEKDVRVIISMMVLCCALLLLL